MRIFVHDYPGHAFALQLSRWLAAQGHEVRHAWSLDVESPRGDLTITPADPGTFSLLPLGSGRPLPKYALFKRLLAEARYGRQLSRAIAHFNPAIILCNAPPTVLARPKKPPQTKLITWVQDLYAPALTRQLGLLGQLLSQRLARLETATLRHADQLIVIDPSMAETLRRQGLPAENLHIIPNWPVLSDLPLHPKNNSWARRHGLARTFVFLYAGTLGLKHNPKLLLKLAQAARHWPGTPQVVVVTQGPGRTFLEKAQQQHQLTNLHLLDYQPHQQLPLVLASADVLLSLLEPAAGTFSVPSKILSYLCAGRAQLAAIPSTNAAAQLIEKSAAGSVVNPPDTEAFLRAAQTLYADAAVRQTYATNGRAYAEKAFDLERIGKQFLRLMTS